jgi:predicted DNA-binding WGR domain protein
VTIGHDRTENPHRRQRRDRARNVARFYVLAVEPSLYGDAVLVRAWGRIGALGRQRLALYASAGEAGEVLEDWLARKVRRGCAPVVCNFKFQPERP